MSKRVSSMVRSSVPWVVSVQLSWGDYVLGLRDLRDGERLSCSELGGRQLVRFVDGKPWMQAPSSSSAASWQRLEAGVRHSLVFGELSVLIWGWSSTPSSDVPARARTWGMWLAVAVALATSPVERTRHSAEHPVSSARASAPTLTALGGSAIEPSPYVLRWAPERQPEWWSNAGMTRCGEAEMGEPAAPKADTRYGVAGKPDNPDPHLTRSRIGSPMTPPLGAESPARRDHARLGENDALSAPWARDSAAGVDERHAVGPMWGDALGDGRGNLGLGLARAPGGVAKGMELRAGGPAAGRRIVQAGLVVRGPRRASEIGRALQAHFAGVERCVERALDSDRDARVSVHLRIDPQGAVDVTSVEEPSSVDPTLAHCLTTELEGARLPASTNEPTEVEYPLVALRDSSEPTTAPISKERRSPPASPCGSQTPCPAAPTE